VGGAALGWPVRVAWPRRPGRTCGRMPPHRGCAPVVWLWRDVAM